MGNCISNRKKYFDFDHFYFSFRKEELVRS